MFVGEEAEEETKEMVVTQPLVLDQYRAQAAYKKADRSEVMRAPFSADKTGGLEGGADCGRRGEKHKWMVVH